MLLTAIKSGTSPHSTPEKYEAYLLDKINIAENHAVTEKYICRVTEIKSFRKN